MNHSRRRWRTTPPVDLVAERQAKSVAWNIEHQKLLEITDEELAARDAANPNASIAPSVVHRILLSAVDPYRDDALPGETRGTTTPPTGGVHGEGIHPYTWNDLSTIVQTKVNMAASAMYGERNDTFNGCVYAVARLAHYGLDRHDVWAAFTGACSDYYDEDPTEVENTFESAWTAGTANPRVLADDMTPEEFRTAMQWVAYVSDHHPEVYGYFLQTSDVTPTMHKISTTPIRIKGKAVTFPGDIYDDQGLARLIRAAQRYADYQNNLPGALRAAGRATTAQVKFRQSNTTENFEIVVDTITARMALEGKTSVIFADDSLNELIHAVYGKRINYTTMGKFKKQLVEVKGWKVVPGKKEHRDKGTVYELDLSAVEHGRGIHPYTWDSDVDGWLKPYEDKFYMLQDHEEKVSRSNADFLSQHQANIEELEELLASETTAHFENYAYVDERGQHRVAWGSLLDGEDHEYGPHGEHCLDRNDRGECEVADGEPGRGYPAIDAHEGLRWCEGGVAARVLVDVPGLGHAVPDGVPRYAWAIPDGSGVLPVQHGHTSGLRPRPGAG